MFRYRTLLAKQDSTQEERVQVEVMLMKKLLECSCFVLQNENYFGRIKHWAGFIETRETLLDRIKEGIPEYENFTVAEFFESMRSSLQGEWCLDEAYEEYL